MPLARGTMPLPLLLHRPGTMPPLLHRPICEAPPNWLMLGTRPLLRGPGRRCRREREAQQARRALRARRTSLASKPRRGWVRQYEVGRRCQDEEGHC
jgi:hypothetical protein